jgi:hypothetical protein
MAKQRIARISSATVGVHRIVGRDEDGMNVEEKVCPIAGETFLDRDGNYGHHALENGRIPSADGQKNVQLKRMEGIRDLGWLPIAECPYTERYFHLVKGPLIPPPEGEKDCGGKPDGCEHWWAVEKARKSKASAEAKRRKSVRDNAGTAAIVKLGESIDGWAKTQMAAAGAVANGPGLQQARSRMRDGKGE